MESNLQLPEDTLAASGRVEELCADQPLAARVEAILLSTDRPMSEAKLAEAIGLASKGATVTITGAINELNQQYEQSGRSFRAERLAGGWQLLTLRMFGPLLARLHQVKQSTKLSQAAIETLAIVAYRQPIMRAEIEAIRGVASGEMLRSLMERRLVKIVGRAEELGRPMLYGTTGEFLKVFGLANVNDLPEVKGLAPLTPATPAPAPKKPRSQSADDETSDNIPPVPDPFKT
ncbi:MAG TPA: SMC-Scp complex subunit ScpB [Phycisphaerales bacterium]|nr:SMC-Scp complex subunit ScpB [Phycisphaerales bacterium]